MVRFAVTAILVVIFWDFSMFYQIFFSLQEKRSMIISNKNSIYKLPHKSLNNLRLMILGN